MCMNILLKKRINRRYNQTINLCALFLNWFGVLYFQSIKKMKILKLSDGKARELYNTGSSEVKSILEESFGKEFFSMKIIDRIKTFEDARDETGRPDVPDFSMLPDDLRKHFEALYKMIVIIEALNEGWTPNWDDNDECKYYPWFATYTSSFAFDFSIYVFPDALPGCESRLRLRTSELAEYAGKQFIYIWKDIQLG